MLDHASHAQAMQKTSGVSGKSGTRYGRSFADESDMTGRCPVEQIGHRRTQRDPAMFLLHHRVLAELALSKRFGPVARDPGEPRDRDSTLTDEVKRVER